MVYCFLLRDFDGEANDEAALIKLQYLLFLVFYEKGRCTVVLLFFYDRLSSLPFSTADVGPIRPNSLIHSRRDFEDERNRTENCEVCVGLLRL